MHASRTIHRGQGASPAVVTRQRWNMSRGRRTCAPRRDNITSERRDFARHGLCSYKADRRGNDMLFTIAVILLVLWLLGLVSGYTMGNFIYVLLVIALVLFVVGLLSGRRTV